MQIEFGDADRPAPDHIKLRRLKLLHLRLVGNRALKVPKGYAQSTQAQLEFAVHTGHLLSGVRHEGQRIFLEHILCRQLPFQQLLYPFFPRILRQDHRRFDTTATGRAFKAQAFPNMPTGMRLVLCQGMSDLGICFAFAVIAIGFAQLMHSFCSIRCRRYIRNHGVPIWLRQILGLVTTVPDKRTAVNDPLSRTNAIRGRSKMDSLPGIYGRFIRVFFKRRQREAYKIRFNDFHLPGWITLVVQRPRNTQHSGQIGHRIKLPAIRSAQLLRVQFMALYDSLDGFPVFIIDCNVFLQKPVGMQTVAAVNNDARRTLQSMQKGEQLFLRLWKILFLMRRPLDVILSMDK